MYEQWCDCEAAIADKEDVVVDRIHALREQLRENQQENEHELDVKIDNLRQAGDKDALSNIMRAIEMQLNQAKRLLLDYGDSAKVVPTSHASRISVVAKVRQTFSLFFVTVVRFMHAFIVLTRKNMRNNCLLYHVLFSYALIIYLPGVCRKR